MTLHPALSGGTLTDLVRATAYRGAFTILDLFDSLPWFKPERDWIAWRAFLAASFGLPMTPQEFALFRECTGLGRAPSKPYREVDAIAGRRSGKSRVSGGVVVPYLAVYRNYEPYLAPGERCTIPVLAKNKDDAQALLGYCKATFQLDPYKGFVERETSEGLVLNNRVDIQIRAARITAGRSRTVAAAFGDEIAFWPTEDSAMPDREILDGIRPAMLTIPGAMLFKLSSPYAERGVLWEDFDRYYGREGPVLVWKAPTLTMHRNSPQVQEEVARAYREDPIAAAAEYGAEFRKDVQAFVTREAVRAVTEQGVTERAPHPHARYFAFVDPSGGASDSMTLAISHWDHATQKCVLDYLDEVPAPFEPDVVIERFSAALKSYRVSGVTGDAYGGEWPRAALIKKGIAYQVSDKPKTRIYVEFLPLLNSKTALLLDKNPLQAQLVGLERRTARGGRDSIDHLPGAKDDVANAVAGALVLVSEQGRYIAAPDLPKQYLTPDGQRDWMGMRADEEKAAVEKAMKRLQNRDEEDVDPRYEFFR